MRIYELALELKTTPKELLRLTAELDLEPRTALATMDDDDIVVLSATIASPASRTSPMRKSVVAHGWSGRAPSCAHSPRNPA